VTTAPAAHRSMLPHEHGAWGQLAMPLLTAFAIGRPTLAALALATAIVAAFLAHEPAIVLLGQRGRRARDENANRARRWLVALGALGVVAGAAGIALSPPAGRVALVVPAALGVVIVGLLLARREKTVAGETAVAAALASSGAAVALAGGAEREDAIAAAIVWTLGFAAATLAVQVILVRVRSKGARDPGRRHAALAALLAAVALGLSAAGLPTAIAWATLPTAVLSIVVSLARFSPKRLRELGWALVASSTLTLVILVVGLR
jgi:hypothetical protein